MSRPVSRPILLQMCVASHLRRRPVAQRSGNPVRKRTAQATENRRENSAATGPPEILPINAVRFRSPFRARFSTFRGDDIVSSRVCVINISETRSILQISGLRVARESFGTGSQVRARGAMVSWAGFSRILSLDPRVTVGREPRC